LRRLGISVLAAGLALTAGSWAGSAAHRAPIPPPATRADSLPGADGPTRLSGAFWLKLTPAEKQIYLDGFLAGAAAEQGRTPAAVDSLRRAGALHFVFAPSVYAAQLDDFYWWQDRVATPIVAAMMVSNGGR